jgi:hypothetical protein
MTIQQTVTIARMNIAWAGGLYCGEGSATASKGRYPQVTMGQKNREVLDLFCAAVGIGKVFGPYEQQGRCPMYVWRVTGRDRVRAVADLLWPWLSAEKREQFERVFAVIEQTPAMPQRRNRAQRIAAGLDPEPPGRSPESVARYRAKEAEKRQSPEHLARRREQYRQSREAATSR